MDPSENLVTIARVHESARAHMLRIALESRGVRCFIQDESTGSIDPRLAFASGGMRIQVSESQAASARRIVNEIEGARAAESPPRPETCPKCSGKRIAPRPQAGLRLLLAVLLLALGVPPRLLNKWRCADCRHVWRPTGPSDKRRRNGPTVP